MSTRQIIALACGLVGALVVWLAWPRDKPDVVSPRDEQVPAPAAEARRLPPLPRVRASAPPDAEPYKEEYVASDGIPIAPPRGEVKGPAHPHPITPQHERLYAENRMIGDLDGAMEARDVPAMRRLLEKYRHEYPEDDQQMQDGYAVIADCFERASAQTRAAAERWIDSHNGSTIKRFVSRYCLEPPQ